MIKHTHANAHEITHQRTYELHAVVGVVGDEPAWAITARRVVYELPFCEPGDLGWFSAPGPLTTPIAHHAPLTHRLLTQKTEGRTATA